MNTPQGGNRPASAQRKKLPVNPSLEHLQKQAKRRVRQTPSLQLATAQHQLALEYGCKNWAELARVVETMSRGADQLANVKMEFEELAKAARAVDMAKVREILASGKFTQHDLDQALAHSLWYGEESGWKERKAIADFLLSHGADPDGQYGSGYGPIVFGTCECLQPEALQYLIDAGADVAFAPIQTKYGKVCPLDHLGTYVRGRNERKHRVIDILLRHGAYVPPNLTPPILAMHRGDAKRLAELLDGDPGLLTRRFPDMPFGNMELRGATLLHCAVEFGEIECLEELFKRYTDINMKADVIDGVGGQTPIFHAINTNCDGNFSTLEFLVKRVGQWVDMSVRATWRMFGEIQAKPMTPLEYAESVNTDESRKWRKMIDRELVILRSLDHAEQLKAAIFREDQKEVAQLLDAHPDLLAPTLWALAIFQAKSLAITRLLLDRGLPPDECSAPRKPLHLAVYQCLPEIVELLIERGADVNLLNPLGERPLDLLDAYEPRPVGDPEARRIRKALRAAGAQDDLYTVIRAGEVESLREMLKADPSLAQADSELGGPLFVAARSGRVEIAKLLLEAGADPNKVNSKGNTPLWFAAQSPARPASDRIAVMKLLLAAGADLHRRCENGSTALHFAAWRGPVEVVDFLLAHGARGWVPDDRGKTPRYDAEERSVAPDKEAIVKRLSQPLIKDANFRAAVDAISAGNLEELQSLLRDHPYLATAQAEENGEFSGPYFARPYLLEFVAENPIRTRRLPVNICAIAQAVIDAGSPASALDKTLALAASGCVPRECGVQAELLELLVKNGAKPSEGLDGAISQGEKEAAETMLRLGAVPGFAAAAGLGHRQRVSELVRKASQRDKESALSVAFRYAQIGTAEVILDSGIKLDQEILDFGTPLHHAAFYGHRELCEWLLKRGADPTLKDSQWEGTPAGWAHYNKHPEAAEFLKEAEGRMEQKHDIGRAVTNNDLVSVRKILDQQPDQIRRTGGTWNKPLLHCAAWEGHLEIVRELVKRGADVNQRCETDRACAIHFAAERGFLEIVKLLVGSGSTIEAGDNDHQLSVLGWATSLGRCEEQVAEFLLSQGAKMTIWPAIALGDEAGVRLLIAGDPALLQARMSRNEYDRSVLHHAVERNQPGVVKLLLELGADPRALDSTNLTVLGAGSAATSPEIYALLETRLAPLNLHDALNLGRFERAQALLDADPGCIRPGGAESRLFVYAVCRKNWAAAEWLLDRGADIDAITEVYGCPATALHFAIESAPIDRVRWLLDKGANTTIRDGSHQGNALNWAEFFGKPEIARMIREHREARENP